MERRDQNNEGSKGEETQKAPCLFKKIKKVSRKNPANCIKGFRATNGKNIIQNSSSGSMSPDRRSFEAGRKQKDSITKRMGDLQQLFASGIEAGSPHAILGLLFAQRTILNSISN